MDPSDDRIRIRLFQAMMDRSSEAILFLDPENRILYWNRAAEVLFEVATDEFPTQDSVKRCALPTPSELDGLRSGTSRRISGSVTAVGPSNSQKHLDRVLEAVEIDGQQWLMVRFSSARLTKPSESDLYRQAHTDHLSGLLNRRGFQITLEENLHRQLALAIIDVDFFKNINDSHGHETGDRAIQWLADRLRENFPSAVCIGRLGGDEFGVVLEALDRDAIENRFQTFCSEISADQDSWHPGGMSISIGVAIAKSPGVAARELLSKADRAMYQSKNRGRNGSTAVDV